jgi:hypothetical protein
MERSDQEKFDNAFISKDSTSTIWNEKPVKDILIKEHAKWLLSCKKWSTFITLTFKNDLHVDKTENYFSKTFKDEISVEAADKYFSKLLKILNEELFGKHYTKTVHHSYTSYVLGTEYQKRGAVHLHVLFDRPVNYDLIVRVWHSLAGLSAVGPVRNPEDAVYYLCKCYRYDETPKQFLAIKEYLPTVIPAWWGS